MSIVLATLNARYQHCSLGLRYLRANLGELRECCRIVEFGDNRPNPRDIVEQLLALRPRIVGLGVYIWNAPMMGEVAQILKKVSPETVLVLGGPEVSHELERQEICAIADYTIRGEGDVAFRELCEKILNGDRPAQCWISAPLPEVTTLRMPYGEYTDEDIRSRVIYVEASRGCPFRCEYCLSSLDTAVRNFDLESFLSAVDRLISRGARQFKFVDRTFNLSMTVTTRILEFFLEKIRKTPLFLHFEMVPDRLPEGLRALIEKFPPGVLQFEVGIQTWNPEVAATVSRRQDYEKIRENFQFLAERTNVHIHADLIAGLPGETLESFARGFDEVAKLGGHEIQLGILKKLRGAPIARHDERFGMVYQDEAPYTVLRTGAMDFATIQMLTRFAKFWELYVNSGNFPRTLDLFRNSAGGSLFRAFQEFSAFLHLRHPQVMHGVSLLNLVESAWVYLRRRLPEEELRRALVADYAGGEKKRDVPGFLRDGQTPEPVAVTVTESVTPPRQRRHQSST